MKWLVYLSDESIMGFLDVVKSDYFLVASVVLAFLTVIVAKTETNLDNRVVAWLKEKLGKR